MTHDEWSTAPSTARIGAIDLKLAWYVTAEPPFERPGFAKTGKGSTAEIVAIRSVEGTGHFEWADRSVSQIIAGQAILFERKQLYRYHGNHAPWNYWWFKFSGTLPPSAPLCQPISIGVIPHEKETIQAIFESLRHPIAEKRSYASALFASLLYGWISNWKTDEGATRDQRLVWSLIDQMQDHLSESWTVEEMSKSTEIGVRRLNQLFHSVVGQSPKQTYDELKLERAIALLQSGSLTVSETANRLGFADPYYFCRWIRSRVGCPPSQVAKHEGIPRRVGS